MRLKLMVAVGEISTSGPDSSILSSLPLLKGLTAAIISPKVCTAASVFHFN
jgi:hypothetical protein